MTTPLAPASMDTDMGKNFFTLDVSQLVFLMLELANPVDINTNNGTEDERGADDRHLPSQYYCTSTSTVNYIRYSKYPEPVVCITAATKKEEQYDVRL